MDKHKIWKIFNMNYKNALLLSRKPAKADPVRVPVRVNVSLEPVLQ
jgi:hypothetical protein